MNRLVWSCVLGLVFAAGCPEGSCGSTSKETTSGGKSTGGESVDDMKAPSDFESIGDEAARSRAVFEEMGRVIEHPRCVNCHPSGERPLMGEKSRPHQPMVKRGPGGFGKPGARCKTCHGTENFRNMPGDPAWHLAPASMSWDDKSLGEICEQIQDPKRNGDMTLEEIVEHMKEDSLVGYGWNPPDHLEAVPGTQKRFGQLAELWVETGAKCPEPSSDG